MSFLNFIKDNFNRVLSLDTEFRMDETKTIPKKVVCFCYEDVFTGERWEFWEHDKPNNFDSHFDNDRNLIVCYNATAEIGSFLNLNQPLPPNVLDIFVEVKRLYLDKRQRGKFSLLDTAYSYGLMDVMTKDEKDKTRDLIIYNESYSSNERREILDYCMEDVKITTNVFKCLIQDIENKKKFENLIINKLGLNNWQRTHNSGQLSTNKNLLKKYSETYSEIKTLLEIRTLQNMTKLKGYQVSFDGRARTSLNMFGTVTGRCTPSTAKFPFSTAKWARNFIKAPFGSVLVYMDYSQQEVAIQAYLSGDQNLINTYNKGDVYLATAKLIKMVPEHATKKSHPKERDIIKVLFLANSYGAGIEWIAQQIKSDFYTARHYKKLFKKIYRVYYKWIESFIDNGFLKQKMSTCYGWQRYLSNQYKRNKEGKIVSIRNSIQNWPIQSHGSEVLRQAILDLTAENFKIIAPVHDALLIEIPIPDKHLINRAQTIMTEASMKVVGGPIRVGTEIIESNYKQLDEEGKPTKDQKMFDKIFNEIENYKKLNRPISPGQKGLSVRYDVSI